MAVTVQMQLESAVTELYEDAFVGSSIENGATMITFIFFATSLGKTTCSLAPNWRGICGAQH
jgi:hypothetical protein